MQRRKGLRGPLHPPGTITLPEGVPELRAERFDRLLEDVEDRFNMMCYGHDQSRKGGVDRHGRFAVLAEDDSDGTAQLTRCSSLKRAGEIASVQVGEGLKVHTAFDLDNLVVCRAHEALPVAHDVAGVHIIVVFNTVAS